MASLASSRDLQEQLEGMSSRLSRCPCIQSSSSRWEATRLSSSLKGTMGQFMMWLRRWGCGLLQEDGPGY